MMLMYLEVLIAIVLDVALWDSKLKWTDYVAAVLIIMCMVAVSLKRA